MFFLANNNLFYWRTYTTALPACVSSVPRALPTIPAELDSENMQAIFLYV